MKIVKRNYLEIKSTDDFSELSKPSEDLNLELVLPPDFQLNKFFYKQIGKKLNWVDRLDWSDDKWIKYLNDKNVSTYTLKEKNNLVGYYEQIINEEKLDYEIAYFGIFEEYIGKKFGGYLLSEAIKNAFQLKAKRIWVHTCSLDHKHALKNYLSRGMKIFKSENLNLYDN